MYNVSSVLDTIIAYGGNTCYLSLFILCVVYCVYTLDKYKRKQMFCIMILSVLCIYNDGMRLIISKFTDIETYYRFLWMIPVIPMLAYCFVDLLFRVKEIHKRVIVALLLLVMVTFGGSSYLSEGCFALPENRYNIPDDVIAVCNLIKSDRGMENPVVAGDVQVQLPLRTYDASFVWGISREAYLAVMDENYNGEGYQNEAVVLQTVLDGEIEDTARLREALEALDINYLVIKSEYALDSSLERVACAKIGDCGEYSVYYFDRERVAESENTKEQTTLNIETVDLVIPGVSREYTFLFFADSHVGTESEDNPEEVNEYAKERNGILSMPMELPHGNNFRFLSKKQMNIRLMQFSWVGIS